MIPSARMRFVAAATVTSALLAFSGAASATPTTPSPTQAGSVRLAYLQGRGDAEIQRRLDTLTADAKLANSATHLAAADRQRLLTMINDDQSGLGALRTKIAGDSSVPQATTDVQSIVTGYRIYVLADPTLHEIIAADRVAAVVPLLKDLSANLQSRIDATAAKGKTVDPAVQAALAKMNSEIANAQVTASPVPGELLAL